MSHRSLFQEDAAGPGGHVPFDVPSEQRGHIRVCYRLHVLHAVAFRRLLRCLEAYVAYT